MRIKAFTSTPLRSQKVKVAVQLCLSVNKHSDSLYLVSHFNVHFSCDVSIITKMCRGREGGYSTVPVG